MVRRSRKRPYAAEHVPLDPARLGGLTRSDRGPGGEDHRVRQVRGSDKTYRCPGCDQMIAAGTPHVVAWPAEHLLGAEAALAERRHWHSPCWNRFGRR
ncbi:hypothetical protein [Bogoriella caseilytica]|uniref:ATP/GTP-binding protein n=1 Tax=Bogoriella caseilytica TaxID=56055 RepID=A0A3N2B9Y0_9MICO|nr:hypothetical protein [Bogoriella caseilytica]ROR72080.1 hypothetical protein EDD31_0426 [Bogoriella caseilytica]